MGRPMLYRKHLADGEKRKGSVLARLVEEPSSKMRLHRQQQLLLPLLPSKSALLLTSSERTLGC